MTDPPRLFELDATAAELRALLSEARADVLDADAVGRVAAGVQAGLGSPPAPQGQGSAAPEGSASSAAAGGMTGKLAAGVVAAAVVATGIWLATPGSGDGPVDPAPVVVAASAVTARSAEPSEPPEAPSQDVEQTPAEQRDSATGAKPSKSSASPAPDPSQRQADLAEEHRLLRAARAALEQNPRRALALTSEHARRFPRGVLAQEREVIAIEAYERLGQQSEARARADEFAEQYPDSPHRDRVRSATTGKGGARP